MFVLQRDYNSVMRLGVWYSRSSRPVSSEKLEQALFVSPSLSILLLHRSYCGHGLNLYNRGSKCSW